MSALSTLRLSCTGIDVLNEGHGEEKRLCGSGSRTVVIVSPPDDRAPFALRQPLWCKPCGISLVLVIHG